MDIFDPVNKKFGKFSHIDSDGYYCVIWEDGQKGRLTAEEYLYGDIEHIFREYPADSQDYPQKLTYQGNDTSKGHSIFCDEDGYEISRINPAEFK